MGSFDTISIVCDECLKPCAKKQIKNLECNSTDYSLSFRGKYSGAGETATFESLDTIELCEIVIGCLQTTGRNFKDDYQVDGVSNFKCQNCGHTVQPEIDESDLREGLLGFLNNFGEQTNKYTFDVRYDYDDEIYVGTVEEFRSLSAHGDTPEEARDEIQKLVKMLEEDLRRENGA